MQFTFHFGIAYFMRRRNTQRATMTIKYTVNGFIGTLDIHTAHTYIYKHPWNSAKSYFLTFHMSLASLATLSLSLSFGHSLSICTHSYKFCICCGKVMVVKVVVVVRCSLLLCLCIAHNLVHGANDRSGCVCA